MNFSKCSRVIQKSCKPKIKNQGLFVFNLFKSIGSNFFTAVQSVDHQYEKKLCSGIKPLTEEMKATVRGNFYFDNLVKFLYNNMLDDKVKDVVTAFGFPKSINVSKNFLAQAIARQYELIFTSTDTEVEDIVLNEYQRISDGQEAYDFNKYEPLYKGDMFSCYMSTNCIKAETYKTVKAKFDILNSGSVPWINRKLVFVQERTSCPIPKAEREINIPNTEPNERFIKEIEIETRGSEGDFHCHFEMRDADGNNCFPNRNSFDIRIKVIFVIK